ncbi:MAG TPA: META domain-containing protein [Moheibacter sp.]|nr:META domain-containing protein [Moheibacter sp.]
MKYSFAISAILGLFILTACSTQNNPNNTQTLNLDLSGNWTLIHIDESSGTNINEGFPNKKPTLILEAISKKLTGNTGCNQMFGSFTTQQNNIHFSGLGSTKMFCDGVKETEYLNMLNEVDSYKILNDQLVFMNKEGKEILKYAK